MGAIKKKVKRIGAVMKKKGNALGQSVGVGAKPDMEYEHEHNHKTVMDAMEIMADPEKMKHVHRLSGRKSKAIRSLKDLHARYQDMAKSSVGDKEEGKAHESKESKKDEKMGE